jgi:serine/threonine-protein kinase RsbW
MKIGPALIDGSPDGASGRRFQPRDASARGGQRTGAQYAVTMTLPARAENVAVVRNVICALAEGLGMSPQRVQDVKLAVTEACTNVVRHAYPGRVGMLDVATRSTAGILDVVVTDQGSGLRPSGNRSATGLGLPLMAAVAQEFEIGRSRGRGTRVRMSFQPAE